MQQIEEDIADRTSRMKSLCLDAEAVAIQTVITLADQDEQLEGIHSHLSSIDSTLLDSRHNIDRLKGLPHRFVGALRSKFHRTIPSPSSKDEHGSSPALHQTVSTTCNTSPLTSFFAIALERTDTGADEAHVRLESICR